MFEEEAKIPIPTPRQKRKSSGNSENLLSKNLLGESNKDNSKVPQVDESETCKSSAIDKLSQSVVLSEGCNNFSKNSKTTYVNSIKHGFFNNITPPDNNDVPNQRETTVSSEQENKPLGEEQVELDLDGSFTNSFLKSSDSLDNNCIINENIGGDSFDEILNGFEAKTVSRSRNNLMNVQSDKQLGNESIKDYMNTMLTSAIGSAKFNFCDETNRKEMDEVKNKIENESFIGYYSEYFGVNKPIYNKCLVDKGYKDLPWKEPNKGMYRAVRCETNDDIRGSFNRKTDVSDLINYFESRKPNMKNQPENSVQMKIFEEVAFIRQKEKANHRDDSNGDEDYLKRTHANRNTYNNQPILQTIIPPPVQFQSMDNNFQGHIEKSNHQHCKTIQYVRFDPGAAEIETSATQGWCENIWNFGFAIIPAYSRRLEVIFFKIGGFKISQLVFYLKKEYLQILVTFLNLLYNIYQICEFCTIL